MRKQVMFGVLAVVLLFGIVGLASADTATFDDALTPGVATNAANQVQAKATVNPKISLTVTTPDGAAGECFVDFGAVDPGTYDGGALGKGVNLKVSSNKPFDVESTQDDTAFGSDENGAAAGLGTGQIVLTRSLADSFGNAKGKDVSFDDEYDLDIPWETAPNSYTAYVTYTVTQN